MAAGGVTPSQAAVVAFGSGANSFTMEFVKIGNPGNAADNTGTPAPAGSVGYSYSIGKYEVSEDMISKYNADFGTANSLVITKDNRGADKAVTGVSWNEAARFVNWLNTSTGGFAAYKFTSGGVNSNITAWTTADVLDYDSANPFRSIRATYVLPSYNEWYKAAYYNPADSTYYDYANGSNTSPLAVASGTAANTAVYGQNEGQGPADVKKAGGLSPYGVMGLGGNVFEWEESTFNVSTGNYNTNGGSSRGIRGGDWSNGANFLSSTSRITNTVYGPRLESEIVGFRVASLAVPSGGEVPEPGTLAIFGVGTLGLMYFVRRKNAR